MGLNRCIRKWLRLVLTIFLGACSSAPMKKPMLMKSVPKGRYRLEGNAEERDSTEYNLALGQKRAEIVRRVLVIMGMPDSELEAVS